MKNESQNLSHLPEKTGVYLFRDQNKKILYIGKAINLKKRVRSYFQKNPSLLKLEKLARKIKFIDFFLVDSEIEALLLETKLIRKHQPPYNTRAKDDKSPLYIKITSDRLPRVCVARKKEALASRYSFGPFPSSGKVRQVLKLLRKTFPFCSCPVTSKKACLYRHLGLCQPSPPAIAQMPPRQKNLAEKEYRQNINNLRLFLSGHSQKIQKELQDQMRQASQEENFEKAAKIKAQLANLDYIQSPPRQPELYLQDPDLLTKIRRQETLKLEKILEKKGLQFIGPLRKIEAYDISNFAGQNSTGSLVVFLDGEPEKNLYRRFQIKSPARDDTAKLREILLRRLKHSEWPFPSLFVIDGGKPQVSACQQILHDQNINLPLLGLAKKTETIVFLNQGFHQITLSRRSPALTLIQRLRDEAHRFAINYHRHLRKKQILPGKTCQK